MHKYTIQSTVQHSKTETIRSLVRNVEIVHFYTMLSVGELSSLLEARRKELGLTQAQVSLRAFGREDTSPLQNIKRGSWPSPDKLKALCDALDLEFYIGHVRKPDPRGFAEEVRQFLVADEASPEITDVFTKGYIPIPWHSLTRQPGPAPLALSLSWLQESGYEPDALRFVENAECVDGPALLLVDESVRFEYGVATWCWLEDGKVRHEWAIRDDGGPFIVFPRANTKRPIHMDPKQAAKLRFLGKVIWSSHFEPTT